MPDRKYRHSGYQDGGSFEKREGPRERPPQRPGEPPQGPRGRGLGAPTATVFRCRACGAKVQLAGELVLGSSCRTCGAELRCCANCLFFDTASPKECRKPVAERMINKVRGNSCPEFSPRTVQEFAAETPARSNDPRAAFDALFKK